ncbi:hypothetical protein LSM04_009334 [Trypanosoma melophagium]|uniref:uncharacterized protein n=1 Tax=Trypanosoma melophagium TaxID=715481 RepID=UPI00351A863E|nr:hypothetical protein LSM04_009334 [Trypanosoma melophagium]
MPPRTTTLNHQGGSSNANASGSNNKLAPKGGRPRREEPKAEEPASPSGPTIKAQITNAAKTSSGKSFLDALRSGAAKRQAAEAPAVVEEPVWQPAPAAPEPEAPVVAVEEAIVETVAAEVEAVVPVEEAVPQPQKLPGEQPPVVEQKQPTPMPTPPPQQQHPVTLPEADAHFSWANDDDYCFVKHFAPAPQQVEPVQPEVPANLVQYPQDVVDAQQKGARTTFKAPADHQTMVSAFLELEKRRCELEDARHDFDEYCKQREIDINERQAQVLALERQLKDQSESLQQERNKLIEQRQQLQQQQQQQQQQQSSSRNAAAVPPVVSQHGTQPTPGYTYSPAMQESMQWAPPPRHDHWSINHGMVAPPYEQNRFYPNMPYQQPRNKPFGTRGGDAPPHMGRGNPMRSNPHMSNNFNGRPMGNNNNSGDVRGPAPDGSLNPMFNQRSQVGYIPNNNFQSQW